MGQGMGEGGNETGSSDSARSRAPGSASPAISIEVSDLHAPLCRLIILKFKSSSSHGPPPLPSPCPATPLPGLSNKPPLHLNHRVPRPRNMSPRDVNHRGSTTPPGPRNKSPGQLNHPVPRPTQQATRRFKSSLSQPHATSHPEI